MSIQIQDLNNQKILKYYNKLKLVSSNSAKSSVYKAKIDYYLNGGNLNRCEHPKTHKYSSPYKLIRELDGYYKVESSNVELPNIKSNVQVFPIGPTLLPVIESKVSHVPIIMLSLQDTEISILNTNQVYVFPKKLQDFKDFYNINNNMWKNNYEYQFTKQSQYFINNYNLNTNFNLFIDIDKNDVILKNYNEFMLKNVDNIESYKNSNNQINIFSCSLFMKPGANFKNRDILVGGVKSINDYYLSAYKPANNESVWTKITELQTENSKFTRDILTYFEILFQNIKLYQQRFPKWIVRIYTDKSISESTNSTIQKYFNELMKKNVQIINCTFTNPDILSESGEHGGIAVMMSRFFPMFDKTVKKFITIEADNWPTDIYFYIIDNWIRSDKLCISFLSKEPYGWPSGENYNDKIMYFRQNFGGMFGLSKPQNKVYNPELFNLLFDFAYIRKERFNQNYFTNDKPIYPDEFHGLLKNKIKYLIDFGIDEVWISLFILPMLNNHNSDSIYAIPINWEKYNFPLVDTDTKVRILKELKINTELSNIGYDIDSLFNNITIYNKNIAVALEIALISETLNLKNYNLKIDNDKYKNIFELTFINLYPNWNSSINYNMLQTTLNEIANKNINFNKTFLLQ